MRILLEDTAAVCVDLQEKLTPVICEFDKVLKHIQILIDGLNILEVPIIVTEQYSKGLGCTIPEIKDHLRRYNPLEKMTFSCCDSDEFCKKLKRSSKKNVIIFGTEAHVCVLQTVFDLLEMGFQPVVVEDCVASRKESDRNTALNRMRQEGAIVTSYESILFELSRVAGTEKFKQISKLVK